MPGPVDLVFADGFESGSTGGWTAAATNGGRLVVAPAAALSGSFGLRATIANRTDMYVADSSPAAATSYHARFQFDPNSVGGAAGKTHTILIGRSAAGANTLIVQVQSKTGGYQVRAGARKNNGTTTYSAWSTITDAPHTLEVGWTAATATNATNGSLSVWIDGTSKPGVTGIGNGSQRIDDARLGPQSIPIGVTGVELFDGFVSTVSSYIGP